MDKIEKIRELACLFRESIIRTRDGYSYNSNFSNFPKGCCGDASDLLSVYLYNNGISATTVSGEDGIQTHSWLEYCDIIIDITADQFEDIYEAIIVSKRSDWHQKFKNRREYKLCGDFNHLGPQSNRLNSLYDEIHNEMLHSMIPEGQ